MVEAGAENKGIELNALDDDARTLLMNLLDVMSGLGSAVVAFSGGTDSSLLAFVASRTLGESLAVIADSPTQPGGELESGIGFCEEHGIQVRVVEYNELDNQAFVENDTDRCYHCKLGLFRIMEGIRDELGYDVVLDGATGADLSDHRPGSRAARELGVRSPLQEAGMSKGDIRMLSRALGLGTWEKPQMACLSSRVQYGQEIEKDVLDLVDEAERFLRDRGYRDVRVRVHGDLVRVEIGEGEEVDLTELKDLVPLLKRRFKYITLDVEGYRTGSMNE